MNGFFITFEGLEGAGKSTQAKLLYRTLSEKGYPCHLTSEPGGTDLGNAIRDILTDNRYKGMAPLAELYLFSAARAQHVERIIRPSLEEGKIIICDRFSDASLAYQGFGRGLPENLIRETTSRASWNVKPDLTFYMDIEPEKGLSRVSKRIQELEITADRIEREQIDFFRRVREGYLYIAREEPIRVKVLDANLDIEVLSKKIYEEVDTELSRRKLKKNLRKKFPVESLDIENS